MKENKSTIIGFVLMTLVFVGYMFYANHQAQKQQEAQMAAQVEQVAEQASQALDTPAEQKVESEIIQQRHAFFIIKRGGENGASVKI